MLKRNTGVAMASNPKPATPTPPKPKPPPEPLPPNPPKAPPMTAAVHTNDYFAIEPCRNCPIAGYLIVRPIGPAQVQRFPQPCCLKEKRERHCHPTARAPSRASL